MSGLGAQTAIEIAAAKPSIIFLLARSLAKVQPVIDEVTKCSPSTKAVFVSVELDSQASVRKAAEEISKQADKIDLLINNAGIMAVPFALTTDGIERQFGTNHVGHFLLTKLLMPKIKAAGPSARVVNVTSDGYKIGPFRPTDYNFSNGSAYDVWSGYGQSKTANILFGKGLAQRGITSFSVHPGVIMSTGLSGGMEDLSLFDQLDDVTKKNTGKSFVVGQPKTPEQGVATTLVASLDPTIVDHSGSYMADCRTEEVENDYAQDPKMVEALWKVSEDLVGEKFEI